MSTAAVNPDLIRWARERAGLTVQEMLDKFPKFAQWESGETQPTFRQLDIYAKKTLTPLGYFFLPSPPDDRLPIEDFRTVGDEPPTRPSPNLVETVQSLQRRQNWLREFLIEEGHSPLRFVGIARRWSAPGQVAESMRSSLELEPQWARTLTTWTNGIAFLRDKIESAGVMLSVNGVVGNNTSRKLDPDEFRGFALVDEYAPLIFVNGADAKSAQMFTIAHELAHIWIGRGGVSNLPGLQPIDNAVEKFCNKVAAEFLLPEDELKVLWSEVENTTQPFEQIAREFKVSPVVVARRALDLGLVTREAFFQFYNAYTARERQTQEKQSGGDFYQTLGVRVGRPFALMVIQAAKSGSLLYRDAYALLGVNATTFDRFAKTLTSST